MRAATTGASGVLAAILAMGLASSGCKKEEPAAETAGAPPQIGEAPFKGAKAGTKGVPRSKAAAGEVAASAAGEAKGEAKGGSAGESAARGVRDRGTGGGPTKLRAFFDEGSYAYKGASLQQRRAAGRSEGIKVSASSALSEAGAVGRSFNLSHGPDKIWDGKDRTAWCEGVAGKGVGQWVSFDLGRVRSVTAIRFAPGYAKDRRRWITNARPRRIEIVADARRLLLELSDQPDAFKPGRQLDYTAPVVDFARDPALKRALEARKLRFVVRAVYPGTKFEDLCISELAIYVK